MIRRILQIVLTVGVLGAGAYATLAIMRSREEPPKTHVEPPAPLVEVLAARQERIRLTVTAEGTVSPSTESELIPEVAGRVVEVSPSLVAGGFFEKGDVLLEIDRREYELVMVRARAAIEQARLSLAVERREAELAAEEWGSLSGDKKPTDLAMRKPQIAQAKAALASAEAELQRAEYDLERTVIRAPFDGRVRQERIDVGQYVSRGGSVATLYAVDAAEIRLPIPDDQLAYVDLPLIYSDDNTSASNRGPAVTLRAEFAGRTHEWQGRVVRTEGEIDPRTRMVHAIARVERPYDRSENHNRPPLAVGMFVHAEIQGKAPGPVCRLPRTVLRGASQVMVVDDDNRLHFREVEIFREEGDTVLVSNGLQNGEKVCTSRIETPVEGMKVKINPAA